LRYFFRRSVPEFTKVLLVESGSRSIFDRLIPLLYQAHGERLEIDLVTCYAGGPAGFRGTIYRVGDYPGPAARKKLYRELASRRYPLMGVICSAEPIMTKWKWMLAARLRAKVFVVNENADFFWLDWGSLRMMGHFLLFRAGITGASAAPTLARMLFFPVTLAYLLLYAGAVHLRRRIRLL
jgi:hypothetical protein